VSKITLQPHHVYRLEYKLQSGNGSWYRYEATMTYLGASKFPQYPGQAIALRELQFSLRPEAGTQTLRIGQILSATDLGEAQGRDDSRHRSKRPLGRIPS
jgi:hypothetical protein